MMNRDIRQATRRPALSATFVRQIRKPGRYGDGNGLYLVVDPSGASRWVLRIQANNRRRDVGLGSAKTVSLADARRRAHDIRCKVQLGQDPVDARRAERDGVPTFAACANKVHAANLANWRNGKHTDQWIATLAAYVFPVIGERPVNQVATADVLRVLAPIWTDKPETARRVHQRIRAILDYATAAGHRSGENPARLAVIGLPRQNRTVRHHLALPYAVVPAFVRDLRLARTKPAIRLALEFLILTAARSGEVRGATFNEFDLATELWTIPAERMKAGRDHVVPLSPRVLAIIREAQELTPTSKLVFPAADERKLLSDMALTMALRRMGVVATAHGFRSSFRDWCAEETAFPGEVAEMALAHSVANRVEAAYRRGKLLAKRRELMLAWQNYVLGAHDA